MRALATRLVAIDPRIVEVRLFGSLARMESVPGSDADVLIALHGHPLPRWFDRIPEFSAAFMETDMPVEVFPYTLEELERMKESGSGLVRAARAGVLLAGRAE